MYTFTCTSKFRLMHKSTAYWHTYLHAYIYTHKAQACCIQSYLHACIHIHKNPHSGQRTKVLHTGIRTCMHTYTHISTHTSTLRPKHIQSYLHVCIHTHTKHQMCCIQSYLHECIHIHTHPHSGQSTKVLRIRMPQHSYSTRGRCEYVCMCLCMYVCMYMYITTML